MKVFFVLLAMIVSVSANAQVGKPKRIYQCVTNTDPDNIRINIISAYGKTYAALYEESCDADCYAEDMIQIKYVDTGADSTRTYVQVPNYNAQYPGMLMKQPSRKTRGLKIVIPFMADGHTSGIVVGTKDPLGEKLPRTELICKAVINAL